MSPKSLVALLLVGLCATQMASAFRHSREVDQLLEHAEEKLQDELANKEDAARSSMETVMGFLQKMEKMALEAGNKKLAELGFPIDLFTISELFKSNCNECVTSDAVKATADSIIGEMSSCVSKDMESLKGLLKNMQGLWATASNMPGSMMNIATQCSEHGDHDIKEDALEPAHPESVESVESGEPAHDLDPVADQILEEAGKSRNRRWIWGLSRITRCVKSVYCLAKNDLITIPGQMLSTATNAYNVVRNAANSAEIPACIKEKTTTVLPILKGVSYEVATCLAKFDLDEIIGKNTKLQGLKSMMDLAVRVGSAPAGALGSATAALGAVSELANGGVAGALGTVSNLANGGVAGALGTVSNLANGGVAGALGALTNGGAAAATGATGAVGAATGVAGAAVGAATGVAGSAVGAATGAAGAAVGAATGVAGAATGAVKGIAGKLIG